MLVLSRKRETEIRIGSDITIKVLAIHNRQVKLGIQAPSGYSVARSFCLSPVAAIPPSRTIYLRQQGDCDEKRCTDSA